MKTKHLLRLCLTWLVMTLSSIQVGYAQYCYISPQNLSLKPGQTATVKAYYEGYDGNFWSYTGNSSIAYITSPGGSYKVVEVTAVGEGSTYIECEIYRWYGATKDSHTFRCNITVIADPPTSISLNKTSLDMQLNETAQLTATISPTTATQKVNWEVLEGGFNVVSVNSSGLITAKAPGRATVRATAAAKSTLYKDCIVEVHEWPSSVELNRTSLNLELGDTAQLIATVLPIGATQDVTWSKESGNNVASISSSGLVTANAVGTVNIMAQSKINNSAYKNCTVTVSEPTLKPGILSDNTLTIGDNATNSNTTVPYRNNYKYSTVQMLYTPTEIGMSGNIKSLSFKVANAESFTTSKVRIYLGHKSSLFGTSGVSSTDLTLVYSGSPTLGQAIGWEKLTFNQGEFNYNCTDNLVVVITKEAPQLSFALKYYCYNGNSYTLYRSSDGDTEFANISNTSISYTASTYRPAIKIEFEGLSPTGINLNCTSLRLRVGERRQLIATVLPNGASSSVIWSSDTPDVAIVEDGMVTALKSGTAFITATTADNPNISATCKVTAEATPDPTEYTDISLLDNVIYLNPTEGHAGTTATLSLNMKNSAAIRGFQFDLYLPIGMTIVKNAKGRIQGSLSSGRLPEDDEHTLTISEQTDGAIRFLCGSQYNETFTGNGGEIATLQVSIAEDMTDGDYPVVLKNMRLSETDISNYYDTESITCKFTISSFIPGDIDDDGTVNVTDYIGIANHILGIPQTVFIEKAGDVDGDNNINVSDYIGVANIILTGSPFGNSNNVTPAYLRAKSTDISTKDNVIYIEPLTADAGTQTTLSFKMKNLAAIRGFQFDLYLPEGVTAVKNNKGRIQGSLNEERLPEGDEHTLTIQEQADGAIRFLCGSQYDETFIGNEGEIATLQVNIANGLVSGDYPIVLKNMRLSETDISKFYDSDNIETILTVGGGKPQIIYFANAKVKELCVANWDSNGDGELSKDEAAAVTYLGEIFKEQLDITSFDELQFFTGLTEINEYAFSECLFLTSVIIPSNVTSIGERAFEFTGLTSLIIPDKVKDIGTFAITGCGELTSVTISNNVTTIGNYAFSGCRSLTTVIIGNSVVSIGANAFIGCSSLTNVYCYAENVPNTQSNAFSNSSTAMATLHVPGNSINSYRTTAPWNSFGTIVALDGTDVKKCTTPTIAYAGGKLKFSCETEGVQFASVITNDDIKSYNTDEVHLSVTYTISVYATKEGYADSEVATATLCWIDANPRTEGLEEDAVTEVKALPVLIQTHGSTISVHGIDNGMEVFVYGIDGKKEGSAISDGNQAVINTNLTSGNIAIIKLGEKAIKVLIK